MQINNKNIHAAIIDLDGVLTRTAVQHALSWKRMFDAYNAQRVAAGKTPFREFSIETDYPPYIDGIPRHEGVKNFLASRNIMLPAGHPTDPAGQESICGLGNRKNEIFLEIISNEGVNTYKKNIAQISQWKDRGLKTAMISSSKNARQVLRSAGIEHLFDICIDGVDSHDRKIPGKPAPDIFLAAAEALQVSPEKALVVEDSQAGIEAARKGNFGLIVGIRNASGHADLLKKGAHTVVENLSELHTAAGLLKTPGELPHALKNFEELKKKIEKNGAMIFLDFDGTLAPIVEKHEDAGISETKRKLLQELAGRYQAAIISGRGLADVKQRAGVKDIFYAGSHGFEIEGPNNFFKEHDEAQKILPVLDELEPLLHSTLKQIKGVRLERKKFTLAVHYRQVAPENEKEVIKLVEEVLRDYPSLKTGHGKKVLELRPALNWHKGKAVRFLIELLAEGQSKKIPLYIGDDITDEDAFEELPEGICILTGTHGQKTYANYRLENVNEVEQFLQKL